LNRYFCAIKPKPNKYPIVKGDFTKKKRWKLFEHPKTSADFKNYLTYDV